jgi:SAM-dependent methyltransferase
VTIAAAEDFLEERPKEAHWHVNPITRAVYDRAEAIAGQLLVGSAERKVLDVGCGLQSSVMIPGTTRLIGIDLDEEGLSGNLSLDERYLVGVEDMPFDPESFDGVVSVYALEHVSEPDVALGAMARLLRPGGVLVAVFPNVHSAKAILTKVTPTRFHVWAYRHILDRNAVHTDDDEHGGPFPTVLDGSLQRDRLERLLRALGLEVEYVERFEDNKQRYAREKVGLVGSKWSALRKLVCGVLGDDYDPGLTEFIVVAQRPRV